MSASPHLLRSTAQFARTHADDPGEVSRIGYLIEELRVALFAQQLRTIEPVSVKRLLKAMAAR